MSTMTTEKGQSHPSRHRKTRRVHVEFIDPVTESVCITGAFNDWRPEVNPMIHLGAGHWGKDLTLPPDDYEYCLVVDGQWKPDPQATETVPNPFGGVNPVRKVGKPFTRVENRRK